MGLISRLSLLLWLPMRLWLELFQAYVWTPKIRKQGGDSSTSNGVNGQNGSAFDREVDVKYLSQEKLDSLNGSMDKWWGPVTPLQGLRAMNKVRIPIVVQAYQKDVLGRDFDPSVLQSRSPLLGAKICDVGCGGGYLTEALTDAGADVVGIDDNESDLLAAKTHWKEDRGDVLEGPKYQHVSVQDYSERHAGEFDVVICSELLEHLDDPMAYITHVLKLVREGGVVVITTNNRTLAALAFAIGWLEHVAAIIPVNTHHLRKFIKPEEIDSVFRDNGFVTKDLVGYLPLGLTARLTWRLQWVLTSFTGVWYAQVARKESVNV